MSASKNMQKANSLNWFFYWWRKQHYFFKQKNLFYTAIFIYNVHCEFEIFYNSNSKFYKIRRNTMKNNLILELRKMRQEKVSFYLGGLGTLIKKKRNELKMTQEELAKGICSNTYLSKFENNAVPINTGYIDMIMERINLDYHSIMEPEEMIEIFEKALIYYIHDNVLEFETLLPRINQVEFSILTEISKLAYYLTTRDKKTALEISDNLYHFLSAMDTQTIDAFIVLSSSAKIMNHQYDEALKILEMHEQVESHHASLFGIVSYLKFQCYGYLGLINLSRIFADEARRFFLSTRNYRRLALLDLYQVEFSYYENETIIPISNQSFLELLTQDEKDRFYLILALGGENSFENIKKISKDSRYYVESLFLNCWFNLENKNTEEFVKLKDELYQICLMPKRALVNYHHWIVLMELGAYHDLRNFLLQHILPLAYQFQSVFLLKKISKEIASFSFTNKRYKDALYEIVTIDNDIAKLQNIKKPTVMLNPQSVYETE
jgi:transcriptional regulator with XRE-family HTH domain